MGIEEKNTIGPSLLSMLGNCARNAPFVVKLFFSLPVIFSGFSFYFGSVSLAMYMGFAGLNFMNVVSAPDIVNIGYSILAFWIVPLILILLVFRIPYLLVCGKIKLSIFKSENLSKSIDSSIISFMSKDLNVFVSSSIYFIFITSLFCCLMSTLAYQEYVSNKVYDSIETKNSEYVAGKIYLSSGSKTLIHVHNYWKVNKDGLFKHRERISGDEKQAISGGLMLLSTSEITKIRYNFQTKSASELAGISIGKLASAPFR